MAWSNSKIFVATLEDILENTTAIDANADTFKAALFDNDITPDNAVASASTAFGAGQWVSAGNEVFEAGQWATGGVALSGVTSTIAAAVYTFDAADTASGAAADLTNAFGVLVYDDTIAAPVADQGWSYNYLGGANSVVNGMFTVVWAGTGIATYTLT